MASVFISYSRKDTDFVRQLHGALEQQALESWVDWEGIPPADDWLRKIHASIEGVDAFVFVMGPDSLTSKVCADEVAHAVKHNKRLIPVVVHEVDWASHPDIVIAEPLRRLNWIFFRPSDDFGAAVAKLVTAIRTDLEWVEAHTRLLGRALEWQAAGRDDSFLLQKNDLVAAEQWLARAPDKNPKPTAVQSDFVMSSRAAATRRQRRLTAAAVAATVLVSIGAIVATVQYIIAEIRREAALSRQLAAQSASAMDEIPDLGLLLSVYAHNVAPTVEASDALLSALDRVRGVRVFLQGEYLAGTLALSADGALMAVGRCLGEGQYRCTRSTIDVWRVAGPQRIGTAQVEQEVWRLAFSGDAKRLAATVCCIGEYEKEQTRALMFDLAGDPSANDGVKLVKVAERLFARWREPSPAAQLTDARAVAASNEALDRVRRAAGASDKAFLGTPAAYGPAVRVLATVTGADLYSPTQVELWEAASSPRRLAHATLRSGVIADSAIRQDGKLAAAFGCAVRASGRICDLGELAIIDTTGEQPRVATVGYDLPDWIRSLAVMPGEPLVLSGGCGKHDYQRCLYGELRLWRLEDGEEKPRAHEPVRTFGGAVESIALSADGKVMGLTSQRGNVSLWQLGGGARGGKTGSGWLVSPLAAKFAPAGADARPALKCGKELVENPVLMKASAQLQTPAELCAALEGFVPDRYQTSIDERVVARMSTSGTRLALGGCATRKRETAECEGGRTTVWSIVDRRLAKLATVETTTEVTSLAFAPDGHRLAVASCSDTLVQLCETGMLEVVELAQEGQPRRTLAEGLGAVTAIAFGPGREVLAFATCARLDDVGAAQECALGAIRLLGLTPSPGVDVTLNGHRGAITDLAFNPDGTLLASGALDGSVALWDPEHRERLGPVLPTHALPVEAIRFVSAETFVSSTESDEMEWHATGARWKSAACRIANRRLTEVEHARFLGTRETVRDPCATPAGPPRGSSFWRWLRTVLDER